MKDSSEVMQRCRPLDFLHFSGTHDGDEVEFCSDEVDWNATGQTIDWNRPTPEQMKSSATKKPAFDVHAEAILSTGEEEAPFDEAPPPSPSKAKKGAYDTRSVIPTHASYDVPTPRMSTVQSSKIHISVVPVLVDTEKNHGVHPSNNLLTPTKSRRNLIICLSFVLLLVIPLLIMASLGLFNKDSTLAPPRPVDTNTTVGSDGDDDVVRIQDA